MYLKSIQYDCNGSSLISDKIWNLNVENNFNHFPIEYAISRFYCTIAI